VLLREEQWLAAAQSQAAVAGELPHSSADYSCCSVKPEAARVLHRVTLLPVISRRQWLRTGMLITAGLRPPIPDLPFQTTRRQLRYPLHLGMLRPNHIRIRIHKFRINLPLGRVRTRQTDQCGGEMALSIRRFRRRRQLMAAVGFLLLTISTAGCSTAPSDYSASSAQYYGSPYPPPAPPQAACQRVKRYPQLFLNRAEQELSQLPSDSAIRVMLQDYEEMRDQARACWRAFGPYVG
jgi:hypothetical protein